MSSRPPYPAPSRTTRSAADWRPRLSPPAASPAASAASSRRANGTSGSAPVQASSIASTTSSPVRMLPWIAKPSPVREPAQSRQLTPVWEAAPPFDVDDARPGGGRDGRRPRGAVGGPPRRWRRRRGAPGPGPCRRRWRRPASRSRRRPPPRRARRTRRRGTSRPPPRPTTRRRRTWPRSRTSCLRPSTLVATPVRRSAPEVRREPRFDGPEVRFSDLRSSPLEVG